MTCNNCGAEINCVIVNHFDHEGADHHIAIPPEDLGNDTYGLMLDSRWAGYGLNEADQLETIWCPCCKQFPFKSKMLNSQEVIYVTCWNF